MSSWAQWSPLMLRPPTGGASAWATGVVSEQIVRAGVVATAGEASTGCTPHDLYGFKRRTRAPWLPTWSSRRRRSCTGLGRRPRPPRRFRRALSCSLHASSGRYQLRRRRRGRRAGRSGSAWSWAPWPSPRPTWSPSTSSTPSSRWRAVRATSLSRGRDDPFAVCRQPHRRRRRRRLPRGQRHAAAVAQGLRLLRKLGTYVEYGVSAARSPSTGASSATTKNSMSGRTPGPYCWPAAIGCSSRGLSHGPDLQPPVAAARFQEGLDLVSDGSRSMKVSLIPE